MTLMDSSNWDIIIIILRVVPRISNILCINGSSIATTVTLPFISMTHWNTYYAGVSPLPSPIFYVPPHLFILLLVIHVLPHICSHEKGLVSNKRLHTRCTYPSILIFMLDHFYQCSYIRISPKSYLTSTSLIRPPYCNVCRSYINNAKNVTSLIVHTYVHKNLLIILVTLSTCVRYSACKGINCRSCNFFIGTNTDTNISSHSRSGYCQSQTDEEWYIFWPMTPVGSVATQKCGGDDSLG